MIKYFSQPILNIRSVLVLIQYVTRLGKIAFMYLSQLKNFGFSAFIYYYPNTLASFI